MANEGCSDADVQAHSVKELYLASNHAQASTWNALHMTQGQARVAHHVALPLADFAAKLWEQEGDGRIFASSTATILAVEAIIRRSGFKYLQPTRSLSQTLYACLREGAGVPTFDAALTAAKQHAQRAGAEWAGSAHWANRVVAEDLLAVITPAEREAVWVLAQAEELLAERNLVLEGRALALLASRHEEVFFEPLHVVFVGRDPLSARWQAFFDACPELDVTFEEPASDEPLGRVQDVCVRLALPSGKYAQPQVILDIIADACEQNPDARFVVTSADALALYERIAPPLAQAGLSCSVEDTQQLAHTDFGRMFFSARSVDEAGFDWDKAALVDAFTSAFSGLQANRVWAWDKRLRGDRLLQFDDVREEVTKSSAVIAALVAGVPDEELLDKALNRLRAQGFSEAYVREQFMAEQGLIALARAAADFGLLRFKDAQVAQGNEVDDGAFDFIWELAQVPIHRVSVPATDKFSAAATNVEGGKQTEERPGVLPRVRIMDIWRASQLAPRSTDVLIACDLTSESYALKEANSTAHMLLDRLGACNQDEVLARERRIFRSLMAVPAQLLVCERPLNDENADPLYPSAMLEELMAAYRAPGEELGSSGIPQALMAGLYERGEEHLLEDVQPVFRGPAVRATPQCAVRRDNMGTSGQLLVPVRADQVHKHAVRLSPSQIEAYLECPYHWFVERRLGADGLDEDLSPSGKGSFLHEVFKTFYERFGKKVTPYNIDEARALMFGETENAAAKTTHAPGAAHAVPALCAGGIFAEVVAQQYAYDEAGHPHSNRYVVRPGTTEELELDALKARVDEWLAFETTFLPTFTPIAFEYPINGILFQGCEVKGIIDRIDVDEHGRAVIIDYKGSLSKAYRALADGTYNATGKIQTLMYASLVQQLPCADDFDIKQVVGALYLSYKQGNSVSGAFNQAALDLHHIPTLVSARDCALAPKGETSFEGLLAFTDKRIAQAVSDIVAEKVAPCPAQPAACTYCPVQGCEKRSG